MAAPTNIPVHVTHHIFRHCNSTHNRKMGATDYEVMELLGQHSTKVHSLYTHAEWQGIVEASKHLGQSMPPLIGTPPDTLGDATTAGSTTGSWQLVKAGSPALHSRIRLARKLGR